MSTRSAAALAAVLLALGCGRPSQEPSDKALDSSRQSAPAPAAESREGLRALGYMADQTAAAPAAPSSTPSPEAPVRGPRKLIRTAQLTVEVPRFREAAAEVHRLAAELGGYVTESRVAQRGGDRQAGTLVLRVPAERFSAALTGLEALGKVRSQATSTQDVTKAYADLETRLAVKREAAARVREILKTRTARLSDVLEAERELARLTEEIERMEGERRYYDHEIALSTITIELQEPAPVLATGGLAPIREALRHSLEVLAASVAAIIYLIVFLTPWLFLGALSWPLVRWQRRRRARARAAAVDPGGQ